MDEKQLQALANELAKNLKTPEDLSQFDRLLKKLSVEAALNAEMTHHLGYEKNQSKPGTNSRNGYSTKTVITADGSTGTAYSARSWRYLRTTTGKEKSDPYYRDG